MTFKHVLLSGVLATFVAFGLLTVLVPQNIQAAAPETSFTCWTCPIFEPSFVPPMDPVTVLSRADAKALCNEGRFCVANRDNPGVALLTCNGCR